MIGWIARHALLFVLLLAGMVAYGQFSQSSRSAEASLRRLEVAKAELSADLDQRRGRAVTDLQDKSLVAIDQRLAEARRQIAALQGAKPRH